MKLAHQRRWSSALLPGCSFLHFDLLNHPDGSLLDPFLALYKHSKQLRCIVLKGEFSSALAGSRCAMNSLTFCIYQALLCERSNIAKMTLSVAQNNDMDILTDSDEAYLDSCEMVYPCCSTTCCFERMHQGQGLEPQSEYPAAAMIFFLVTFVSGHPFSGRSLIIILWIKKPTRFTYWQDLS